MRKPAPATVIALIALFVSLGGTTYANEPPCQLRRQQAAEERGCHDPDAAYARGHRLEGRRQVSHRHSDRLLNARHRPQRDSCD